MADDNEVLDRVSPRKQQEIDNQAAFLRYLLEGENAQGGENLERLRSPSC